MIIYNQFNDDGRDSPASNNTSKLVGGAELSSNPSPFFGFGGAACSASKCFGGGGWGDVERRGGALDCAGLVDSDSKNEINILERDT